MKWPSRQWERLRSDFAEKEPVDEAVESSVAGVARLCGLPRANAVFQPVGTIRFNANSATLNRQCRTRQVLSAGLPVDDTGRNGLSCSPFFNQPICRRFNQLVWSRNG
jgi:hypothetical protein